MNEILVLTDAFKGLKTTLKNKRRYIWVFLVSFLIGWAILLIFWPSQKPARAYETTQLYFDSITTGGIFTLLPASTYPYSMQISTSSKEWGYDTEPTCTAYNNIMSGSGSAMFYDGMPYINSAGTNNISYLFYPVVDGDHYLCFGNATLGTWYYIHFSLSGGIYSTDEYIPPPTDPTLTITSPADGSAQTTNFEIEATYDLMGYDYDRTMIIFEDWDASSTCPIYGTQEFTNEMALGYFNNQSQPYFSDYFATATGTTNIAVSDLAKGNYRCVRCYFINETTATSSVELCNGYGIEIPNTLPATIPTYYQGQNWATFYTDNGDKWATSTELFAYLAGKTAPLLLWVGNFTADFKNLFNNASSSAMGQQLGSAIPQARGYLTIINYYFAGIPIGEVFIFYLLTALILIVLKVVLMIWHFFRG